MTITLAFSWWIIPTIISIVLIGAAMLWPTRGGYLQGIETIFRLIPALVITTVAWIVAAVLK